MAKNNNKKIDAIVNSNEGPVLNFPKKENGVTLNDEEAKYLATQLQDKKELKTIRCLSHEIGDSGAAALIGVKQLTMLSFLNNKIENGTEIGKALEKNESLTDLDLRYNKINDKGAKAIANALKNNKSLTGLDLNGNQISDEGAQAIAGVLKNTSLTVLDLSGNQISDEGAQAIAKALENNKKLETLNLSGNKISDKGAEAIAKALENNTALKSLTLDNNNISNKGAEAIAKALENNKKLRYLTLNNNYISDKGAKAIVKALENSKDSEEKKTLKYLTLNNNYISDKGAEAIAALKNKTSLGTLKLDETKINNPEIKHDGSKVPSEALELIIKTVIGNVIEGTRIDKGKDEMIKNLRPGRSSKKDDVQNESPDEKQKRYIKDETYRDALVNNMVDNIGKSFGKNEDQKKELKTILNRELKKQTTLRSWNKFVSKLEKVLVAILRKEKGTSLGLLGPSIRGAIKSKGGIDTQRLIEKAREYVKPNKNNVVIPNAEKESSRQR